MYMRLDILYDIFYHIIFYYFTILLFYYYIMKLSRRGKHVKSTRRGRHTKRAGKHLRYRGKKVRASKRYSRGRGGGRVRTYKRGKRLQRGGEDNFTVVWDNKLVGRAYSLTKPSRPTFFYLTYKKKKSWFDKTSKFIMNICIDKTTNELTRIDLYIYIENIVPSTPNFTLRTIEQLTDKSELEKWIRKDKKYGQEDEYNFNFPKNMDNLQTISAAIRAKIEQLNAAADAAATEAAISRQKEIESQNVQIESGERDVIVGEFTENYVQFKSNLEKLALVVKDEDTTSDKTQKVDSMVTEILKKQLEIMIQCNVTTCKTYPPDNELKEINDLVEQLRLLAPKLYEEKIKQQKDRIAQLLLASPTTSMHDLPPQAQYQVGPGLSEDILLRDENGSLILNNQGRSQLAPRPQGPSSQKELAETI